MKNFNSTQVTLNCNNTEKEQMQEKICREQHNSKRLQATLN
jgi:hypothetical protein